MQLTSVLNERCTAQVRVASLLGPAMPLFCNLREFGASWAGDGLDRSHLNCLQGLSMLEYLSVTYDGDGDLGHHFPTGECLMFM
jgi:hypothetical protein